MIRNNGSLRPLCEGDLKNILPWRNHPSIRAYMYNDEIISENEHMGWWGKISKSQSDAYFIYKEDGIDLGVCNFTQLSKLHRRAFWAFYARPDAPKGIGKKMEYLMLTKAFEELGLVKLNCEVLSSNMAVVNLHKKFGFVEEGQFSKHILRDQEWLNVFRLALFEDVWFSSVKHELNPF
jgi:UDP-4-amino-4,6-dideoxy-N-acetyl-beta-L-altrosamine N-acetyltransferase